MKKIETFYQIELTPAEIETITTALHGEYKFRRDEYKKATPDTAPRLYERMAAAQTLRNELASIIGTRYMGEDA